MVNDGGFRRTDRTIPRFSSVIDIKKLEGENRFVFRLGFIVALLVVAALDPFLSSLQEPAVIRTERDAFRIPLTLVEIKRPVETPPEPLALPEETPAVAPSWIPDAHAVIETAQAEADSLVGELPPDRSVKSVLLQPPPFLRMPSLVERPDSLWADIGDSVKIDYLNIPHPRHIGKSKPFDIRKLRADIPLTENTHAILGPGYGVLFWDPFPGNDEVEDERRQFKYDILGVPIGGKGLMFGVGPGSVFLDVGAVVNTSRHSLKSIVWKIQDMVREGRIQMNRDTSFARVNEKDIRFMVLMWRYDRVDPKRISRKDRLFVARATSEQPGTFSGYMELMEKRGLASSLQKNGRLLYKSNFSRDEILHTFVNVYSVVPDDSTKNIVLSYITIINDNTGN